MTGNSTAWKMVEIGNLIFREIELPGFSGQQKENNKAMRRIKLTVAYDGTAYKGWQLQPNGVTIEEMLNKALSDLLKEPVCVIGASRTDSGVHARGNVAVFDTESRIPGDKFCYAVNRRLPEDIRVVESEEVPLDWHPRKQNCVKTYEYQILNCKIEIPTRRLYAHFCYYPLNVEKMNEAAKYLIGEERHVGLAVQLQRVHVFQFNVVAVLVGQGDEVGAEFLAHGRVLLCLYILYP